MSSSTVKTQVPKITGDKMEGPDGAHKDYFVRDFMSSYAVDQQLARVNELKLKIQEASKVRMANFGFPQPPYDRLYSWTTGMIVMIMELEQQESLEN